MTNASDTFRDPQTGSDTAPLRAKWGWIVALGVVYLLAGFIALGSVAMATVASVLVVGVMMIVAGVAEVVSAFQIKSWGKFLLWVLLGVLYIIAGGKGRQKCRPGSLGKRSNRTKSEAVVHAHGDHVHVLVDAAGRSSKGGYDERVVGVAHEQVVVFNAGRPVRSEAILESDPHGGAPAGRACREKFNLAKRGQYAEIIARHRRAALQVQQCRVPGPTDLAGEKADGIGLCASREEGIEKADARAG